MKSGKEIRCFYSIFLFKLSFVCEYQQINENKNEHTQISQLYVRKRNNLNKPFRLMVHFGIVGDVLLA